MQSQSRRIASSAPWRRAQAIPVSRAAPGPRLVSVAQENEAVVREEIGEIGIVLEREVAAIVHYDGARTADQRGGETLQTFGENFGAVLHGKPITQHEDAERLFNCDFHPCRSLSPKIGLSSGAKAPLSANLFGAKAPTPESFSPVTLQSIIANDLRRNFRWRSNSLVG